MIIVRDRHTRGNTDAGWLDSRHTFGWLHGARGLVHLSGDELPEGDGARFEGERRIELCTDNRAQILLFDLE